ncbi:hypothetical protein L611_000300000250 [Aminobacter sp. J15]|nr:hypothetical protein L611_000300000250 [Aminobacter sp. J15]
MPSAGSTSNITAIIFPSLNAFLGAIMQAMRPRGEGMFRVAPGATLRPCDSARFDAVVLPPYRSLTE